MKTIITLLALIMHSHVVNSQSIGIGTTTPNQSALLDMQSNSKGMLIPRMNSTERNMIASPATGLLIFDTDKGAIHMYDGNQWLPLAVSNNSLSAQPRTSNTPTSNSGFGWRSCISGNYAVISSCKSAAVGAGPFVDTVFVFQKVNGGWEFMSKLVQSNPAPADGFGRAVAISGDYILVGAPNKNSNAGAVYVFTRSGQTWTQTAILTPTTPVSFSRFGSTISMSGTFALIGAPSYNVNGVARGTVYSFSRNISTWTQVQQLWGLSNLEDFGASIDISGTYALIGAPYADHNGIENSGIAYYFRRDGGGTFWNAIDTIYNTFPAPNDLFGFSVAINESTKWAFISRPNRDGWNENTGDICTYTVIPSGLAMWGKLINPVGYATDFKEFGYSISVYNDYLLVGVPTAYNDDAAKGRVYVYKYDPTLEYDERWKPWKMLKDEGSISANWYYDTYGLSVFINGFDVVITNPGANNFVGKALFLNIFQ